MIRSISQALSTARPDWRVDCVSSIHEATDAVAKGGFPDLFVCHPPFSDGAITDFSGAFRMARSRVRVLALLSAEISFVGDMQEDFRIVGRLNLPFDPGDLLEEVIHTLKNEGVEVPSLGNGPLELNSGRVFTVKGRPGSVKLTSTQAKIIDCLLGSFGDLVSKEDLYRHILNREPTYDDRSLDQHIFKLRNLLKGEPFRGDFAIETVRGVGYRLVNS